MINNNNKVTNLQLAIQDILDGMFGSFTWFHLAWQDIKQRYRRSTFGPLWVTISTAVMLGAMGPLYAIILKLDIGSYFRYLGVSLVVWTFISAIINESCNAFISAENFIRDIKLPYTIHLLRIFGGNLIIFGHNFIVIIIILAIFPPERLDTILIVPFCLLLVVADLFWLGLFLAMFCTRFRDVRPIVNSFMTVAFFVTPVVWKSRMLGKNKAYVDFNPLYHMVDIIRSPLLGVYPSELSWVVLFMILLIESAVVLFLFSHFRSRIPYWL